MTNLSSDVPSLRGKPIGRRERKKLDTRRRIFRAAFELFTGKGFDATTVEEIAEQADVGKGTVFNYFPQKTAFLIAAYQEWVELMQETLGPLDSWEGSALSQLSRMFGYLTDKSVEHRALARLIIFENMRQTHLRMTLEKPERPEDAPSGAQETGALDGEHEAVRLLEFMTQEVIRKGKGGAEIRPEVDEIQAASLIAAAGFHTLVRGLVRGASSQDIKAALAAKLDIIFMGLAL